MIISRVTMSFLERKYITCHGLFVTETFKKQESPSDVSDDDQQNQDNIVVLMYDRYSAATGADKARLDMLARKQRSYYYDALPPTRAAYQSVIIWGQATVPNPETSSPAD